MTNERYKYDLFTFGPRATTPPKAINWERTLWLLFPDVENATDARGCAVAQGSRVGSGAV